MRKFIVFIQSVSANEWEVGEIQSNEINHNPDYSDYGSEVFYIKTFEGLKNKLMSISNNDRDSYIVIQITAHSNSEGIVFKDINNINREDFVEYVRWSEFHEVLEQLHNTFGTNITLILISCYSSVYAESIKTLLVPIIAAEGEISARRAGEQLIKFYEKICTGSTVKEAYDFMIESYPIEDEMHRNENDRSILKLYM